MIKISSSSSSCFSSSRYLKSLTFFQKKRTLRNPPYNIVLRQKGNTCKLISNSIFGISSTFTFVRFRKKTLRFAMQMQNPYTNVRSVINVKSPINTAMLKEMGCFFCVVRSFDRNNLINLFYAPNTFFDYLVGGFLSLQVIYGLFFIIAQETDFLNKQFYLFNLFLFAYLSRFQYLLGLALANCLYNSVIGVPLGKKWLINSKFSFSSLIGLFSNQPYDWILNKFKTVEEVKKKSNPLSIKRFKRELY